ncbi:mitochondrial carrier domain-containing protein [Mycotypha africana]|uniref:mitochondrial carrier domain-containing protein n=1 Tax=Mycotypha africana TaxID=64632 RepID=UPI00230184F3|nr:mitochondrial carrier domain-containing protein [Mycotypha africana]KAI8984063.1 mitochondrial carrier domain-containing protein [Mycotypha africana]
MLSSFVGSAPKAALFFVTYEAIKRLMYTTSSNNHQDYQHQNNQQLQSSYIYMTAATCGEISACTIRVPTEVIKQRMQINQFSATYNALSSILRTEGILGLYRGFLPTVAREIPFTCIQFPMYEYFKYKYTQHHGNRIVQPFEAAMMGSIAGGIAAAITTPLDVCKTRIILSTKSSETGTRPYTDIVQTMKRIISEEGPKKLFAEIGPRVMWISLGGTIFFGVYEKGLKTFNELQLLER